MSDDMEHLTLIRENVSKLLGEAIELFDKPEFVVLEVAPQIYDRRFRNCQYHSLDIDPQYDCTYIADITKDNSDIIPSDTYDLIVCTEVLEHTLQPFHAADEMHRMLKPGGVVYGSTPFDLYIHPPLPDCWRFTEQGLRELFRNYSSIEIEFLHNDKRWGCPVHYTFKATK